jgi:hypothetical protein
LAAGHKQKLEEQQKRHAELIKRISFYGTPEKQYADSGLWAFLPYVRTKDEHVRSACLLPVNGDNGHLKDFIRYTFLMMLANPVLAVAKSRQMMISWLCAIWLCWRQRTGPHGLALVQSKEEKAATDIVTHGADNKMAGRISFIEHHLPPWLQDTNIVSGKGNKSGELTYSNHSRTMAAAQGADKTRSYTLTDYMGDEAAFQDEFEEAFTALLPTIENGGRAHLVSTAQESFFAELVTPAGMPDGKRPTWSTVENTLPGLPRGMKLTKSKYDIPVLWLHYTADPDKDPATEAGRRWYEEQSSRAGGASSPKWMREREIDFNIRGGLPVFTFLSDHSSPVWTPPPVVEEVRARAESGKSRLYAGYDHGSRNPSAFVVWEFRQNGEIEAIWEHYKPNLDFGRHCNEIRACPYFDLLQYTKADPTVINRNSQYTGHGMETLGNLYVRHGVPLSPGRAKVDVQVTIERFLGHYWSDPKKPKAFISAACPNLKHEAINLRWEEHTSAKTSMNKNNPERIMDKNNHAWDATCYVVDSRPAPIPERAKMVPYMSREWLEIRAKEQRGEAEHEGLYV